jgi:surface antigen
MRRHGRGMRVTGLLVVNAVLVGGVLAFVLHADSASQTVNPQVTYIAGEAELSAPIASPLDQLSSTEIAVYISQMAQMETAIAVSNQADSVSSRAAVASDSEAIMSKPQIVATDIKTKNDIITHTVAQGDTIESLAEKFSVTSDSIRWSNGLSNWSTLRAGQKLKIPPVNGVVYTVKSGETADTLAERFGASKEKIVAFNDAEISGLVAGEVVVIPGAQRSGAAAARTTASTTSYASGFAFGSSPVYGYNGYVPGYCTYYVASRVSIPTNWGNARNWAAGARATPGWTVSTTPQAGAIAQTTAMHWLGHVAYVEEVSEDRTMIRYSDMNGIAGFNRVGYSGWVPASTYQAYIHR